MFIKNIVLYRGVKSVDYHPTDRDYDFFAKDKSFASDYGQYIWMCEFESLNLFVSYKLESFKELYDKGYKLTDTYIEDRWDNIEDEIKQLYDYDGGNSDNWGYKSAQHAYQSPYSDSDTWEMIENTHGVLDYILSKYDGVELLEGGEITYYLRTDKIVGCRMISKELNEIKRIKQLMGLGKNYDTFTKYTY